MKKNLILLANLSLVLASTLVGCQDDDKTSELPVFDKLTVSPTTAAPGDTITAVLTFEKAGKYGKGTYNYYSTPAAVTCTGGFELGFTQTSYTFKVIAPDSLSNYTLTVKPVTAATYAGQNIFTDPAPMGTVSATFTVGEL